jgi:Rrf2 family protein
MKLSTKGRYGLRAMVDLAVHSSGEHVALYSIAERQNISENYLEQVFSILRKAGLVKSVKGAQGGYTLADKPSNISIGAILRVLEGDLSVPRYAKGIVIFAHGSGSSRYSPRNRYVARTLQDSGLATLLFDLLTIQEEDVIL